jgi:sugar transferase (PEP-CTERM/EpsH1 system associated)
MANLLYLVHRLPYPPNKGDKVRSFHLLQHLAARHRVYLGTFVDDPEDESHLPQLSQWCAEVHAVRLHPRRARLASLAGLATGQALTLRYYHDTGLHRWVDGLLARQRIDAAVVFSSSMAPYAQSRNGLPMLVDFVDVDSAKWTQYAGNHAWPLSWLYAREGRRLLAFESEVACHAQRAFFVTDKECALFASLAPACAAHVEALGNGVDAAYFAHQDGLASPFARDEIPLVFTGAMDYWPNVDAVVWFANEVLPRLRHSWPALRLHVVGRSPTPAVQALAGDAVSVSGTVPDVRPYLQHARVVVAPLRLARGIQNKILEAMAMGRPVVAAQSCVDAIDAEAGAELQGAQDADDYVREVDRLLRDAARAAAMGAAARECVLRAYSWTARLSGLDRHLEAAIGGAGGSADTLPAARGTGNPNHTVRTA